jgi:hypothetical protein
VLPADCCRRRFCGLLRGGDPLVSDLELVRIPALDPSWSSSPLIRGLLLGWTHKDDSRSLEPSFEQPCVPAMVFGVYPIFNSSVCARRSFVRSVCAAPGESGGDEETRTPDPLLAKEMLFQLSYVPSASESELVYLRRPEGLLRGSGRPPLSRGCRPSPCEWWAFLDSNQRPLPYQGSALTS